MKPSVKRNIFMAVFGVGLLSFLSVSGVAKGKKDFHPFDLFTDEIHHGMHDDFFKSVPERISCETCHVSDDSYERGKRKVNPKGCHFCHNPKLGPEPAKEPPMDATSTPCSTCHVNGWFPKPKSHKAGWKEKHQVYAKKDPDYCTQCHSNSMFCLDCHKKRDTVAKRGHGRNFRFTHSIQARANPRKCDACHTINYCQNCHAGRGTSKQ
ncbi:MAG: hypothetical protein A3F89_08530 [Deltaproteobacteria bacterium RIFCSPLOWO2_12_FULL_50_11]|nr:MAG: hypothetical protein A3F89_08530 [Deltaproteobacteria bacterium RIFCSPLOWO2_12_FULL_50_11]